MNVVEIAWAAGLFEGEGSVYPYRSRKAHYPRVDLASTDEDVVRRFARVVDSGSSVYGPIQSKRYPKGKPFWRWQATGTRAVRVMALLAPYLGERRSARLTEVLAQCESTNNHNRKESL